MWIEFLVLIENHPDIGSRGSLKDATSRMDELSLLLSFLALFFRRRNVEVNM